VTTAAAAAAVELLSIKADESEAHLDIVAEPLDNNGVKVVSPASAEEAGGDNARGPEGAKWAHAGSGKEGLRDNVGDGVEGVAAVGAAPYDLVGVETRPERRALEQEVVHGHDPLGIASHAAVVAVSVELEQVGGETDSDALASKAGAMGLRSEGRGGRLLAPQ